MTEEKTIHRRMTQLEAVKITSHFYANKELLTGKSLDELLTVAIGITGKDIDPVKFRTMLQTMGWDLPDEPVKSVQSTRLLLAEANKRIDVLEEQLTKLEQQINEMTARWTERKEIATHG